MDIANLIIRVTNEGLDRATRELRRLQDNAAGAQSANEKFGKSIADLNKLAMVGFGALTGVVALSTKRAIEFESVMGSVAKVVDETANTSIKDISDGLKELSKTTPLSVDALGDIAAAGGSLGVVADDIIGFTDTVSKMAVAFDMSADMAGDAIANLSTVLGKPIDEMKAYGDMINQIADTSSAKASEIVSGMLDVGGAFKAFGVADDYALALTSTLITMGKSGSEAGTVFKRVLNIFGTLDVASKGTIGSFDKLGIDIDKFSSLMKTDATAAIEEYSAALLAVPSGERIGLAAQTFGGAYANDIVAALTNTEKFNDILGEIELNADGVSKALGSLEREYETVSATTANKLQLVKNNIDLVAISIGDAFLPALNDLILAVVPVIERLGEWSAENPELIRQIVLVAGALTGSIIAIATISGAIGTAIGAFQGVAAIVGVAITVFKALLSPIILIQSAIAHLWPVFVALTSPIGLAVLAIAALIAIGVVLYKNWDTIKEKAAELWQSVVAAWDGLVASTSETWDSIVASVSGAWDSIVSVISGVWDSITSAVNSGWQAIVYAFENPKETILNILSSLWDNFKAGVEAVFTLAVKIFIGGWIEIFKTAVQFKDDLIQTVISIKEGAVSRFHALVDGAINLWHDLVSSTKAIWQGLISGAIAMIDGIKSAVTSGINAIKDFFSGGWRDVWNDLKVKLVGMVQSVMDAMTNFAKSVANGMAKVKTTVIEKMTEVLSWLRELPSKVFTIGLDFAKGFVNGIKAIGSGVLDAAKSMASGAVNIVKKEIDSHSPSKVTTKLGGDFSQGMANGIKKGAKAVKSEAQKMAESAVKAVQDGVANLKREIALFGNDSPVAALKYDISVGKFGGADTSQLMSLTQTREQLELSKKLADANKSVQDSIDGLIKQQALFGNNSSLASLMYDIEHTEKYKNITQELKDELIAQTKAFEQLGMTAKATQAIQERFAKLRTDQEASGKAVDGVMGELQAETAIGKIQADYERRIEVIRKHEELTTGLIGSEEAKRIAIYESAQKAKELLQIQGNEKLFGELSSITSKFFGEQSAAHKAMFLVEKYFALKRILVENQVALSKAWASASFPYNLPAVATVAAQTGLLAAAVKGFKAGGYTGNGGASQVAGVVHGQEYVFDAQSTKRIGVDNLNAMRSGKAVGETKVIVNNYSNEKANVQTTPDGDTIVTIGKIVSQMVDGKLSTWERNSKRQGHALHGMR